MPHPLRVLLHGYGLAGRVFHAPLIAAAGELELAAVVTGDPARAAAVTREHPDATVLPDAASAFERADDFDLAVVATANVAHVPLVRAALDHGLHVVVDKPMAPDAMTGKALVEYADAADRQLHVFQNRRWDSDFLTLQSLMVDGRLGRVHRIESRFERWRPVSSGGWREDTDPAAMGGLLYDLGSHLVDQAILAAGPVTSVYAEVRRVRERAGVDDDVFVALTHAGHAVSHLWASALAADPAPRFRVLGDAGSWVVHGLDGQEDALREGRRPGDPQWGVDAPSRGSFCWPDETVLPLLAGGWDRYYPGVAASIMRDAPPPVDPGEVVEVLRVLDAARESAATGTIVWLDPPAGDS
jgi:predicted dehydrogenase